jgi:hypothetical protein
VVIMTSPFYRGVVIHVTAVARSHNVMLLRDPSRKKSKN